jgi:DNA-binding MarR family transcriptional regulator
MPQYLVLDILSRNGESKMTDLAHFLNVTTAAITGVVDRLCREGYAVRIHDAKDRRVVRLRLTAKGTGSVRDISAEKKSMIKHIFGMISQREREEYLAILTHINDIVKQQESEA